MSTFAIKTSNLAALNSSTIAAKPGAPEQAAASIFDAVAEENKLPKSTLATSTKFNRGELVKVKLAGGSDAQQVLDVEVYGGKTAKAKICQGQEVRIEQVGPKGIQIEFLQNETMHSAWIDPNKLKLESTGKRGIVTDDPLFAVAMKQPPLPGLKIGDKAVVDTHGYFLGGKVRLQDYSPESRPLKPDENIEKVVIMDKQEVKLLEIGKRYSKISWEKDGTVTEGWINTNILKDPKK